MIIKEVSEKFNVTPDTLRYYERIGLVPPVTRDSNGYRDYSDRDQNWVYFVKVLRKAGLSIEALIEFTRLAQDGDETLEARKELLEEQLTVLDERMKEVEEARGYLQYKIDNFYSHIATYEKDKLGIGKQDE